MLLIYFTFFLFIIFWDSEERGLFNEPHLSQANRKQVWHCIVSLRTKNVSLLILPTARLQIKHDFGEAAGVSEIFDLHVFIPFFSKCPSLFSSL